MLNRLLIIVPSSLLIVLNIFVFGPAAIYSGNASEFGIGFSNIEALYIFPVIISFVILSGTGILLPKKIFSIYVSIIFATGILLWLQGNILVWDYGVFDGSGIKWTKYQWQGWVDAGLWIIVLILALVLHKKIPKISRIASIVIIVLQCIFFIYAYPSSHTPTLSSKAVKGREAPAGLFNYSESFNIIHVLLDGFQTDLFQEIVEEKGLASDLDGFVLFKENMAAYNETNFSLPSIFSGEVYQGDEELKSYINEVFLEKAFYNFLFKKGYDVNLATGYPMPAKYFSNYFNIPKVYAGSKRQNENSEAATLIDVVLFRHLPQYLKKKVYNHQNWLIRSFLGGNAKLGSFHHIEFFQDYIDNIKVSRSQPAYHFVHLMLPHPPYVTTENCEYAGKVLPYNRISHKKQAQCAMLLFERFLERLRMLGIYDSSFILLHGDHGWWSISSQKMENKHVKNKILGPIGRAFALLATKPPNNKGLMAISNAKTTLTDIPSTVMKIAGLPNHYEGPSVFDLDPDGERERWFFVMKSLSGNVIINSYKVTHSVFDYQSWNREKDITKSYSPKIYKWGTPLQFGFYGNAKFYQREGWSLPKGYYTWTHGEIASLSIPITMPKSANITLKVTAFIDTGINKQTVNIVINGTEVEKMVITRQKYMDYSIIIPKSLLTGSDHVIITFNLPDVQKDLRGIALKEIVLIDGRT
ncbi:MAG: hypothetical protein A2W23_10215 [Planctomycetes bacterium RBG_16_43_13]|nr:MAG: hypothetical protein A2W23_10215 [Planctomycetes bacterium RBG_16_43_13]